MRALSVLWLFLIPGSVLAATDPACQDSCLRQGGGYKYCADSCRYPGGSTSGALSGGMADQPGLAANPGFGQLQQQGQPVDPSHYGIVDSKCFKDCIKRGYLAPLCQKNCSF